QSRALEAPCRPGQNRAGAGWRGGLGDQRELARQGESARANGGRRARAAEPPRRNQYVNAARIFEVCSIRPERAFGPETFDPTLRAPTNQILFSTAASAMISCAPLQSSKPAFTSTAA